MTAGSSSRRGSRRKILCRSDGSLYDVSGRQGVTPSELRDHVRDGGLFEARREDTEADCTFEVLCEIAPTGALEQLVPSLGSGAFSGLDGLGGLASAGGLLATLRGGPDSLAHLARSVSEVSQRDLSRGWDAGSDRPRRRRRASPSEDSPAPDHQDPRRSPVRGWEAEPDEE